MKWSSQIMKRLTKTKLLDMFISDIAKALTIRKTEECDSFLYERFHYYNDLLHMLEKK